MKVPASLKQEDKIGIMAPARKISTNELEAAIKIIESRGFEVELGNTINASENQFAGSDELRSADLQRMLDNYKIKAIFFARGGYGSVKVIDKIDFSGFVKNPKWLVGYSDMTVFHCHCNKNLDIETLHASMPINFADNSKESLDSLFNILSGLNSDISVSNYNLNKKGKANGELIGGNLSVLYSMLG
ncbi:MAG: LD-carboxypeptidase, partial [Draconibacterium sp.]|nr:LD-carboxypeptidase [Draconibacterium sp.]